MSIAAAYKRIQDEIADACVRARRDPATVQLMAVSKTKPPEVILEACMAGARLFGENRVQEFAAKSVSLASIREPAEGAANPARFHLIGPLQSNKAARAAELFDAFDALDSFRIAQRLDSAAAAIGKTLPVLIEVKLSTEESKHGIEPEALEELLAQLTPLDHLRVRGLMTVPPWSEDPEDARPYFARLRELRDAHRAAHPSLEELSMGMSHDFAVAIEEGATTVRVGTALFGARNYS